MKNSEAGRYAQFCRHAARFGLSVAAYRAKRERGEVYCPCCCAWKSANEFDSVPRDRTTWKCKTCT